MSKILARHHLIVQKRVKSRKVAKQSEKSRNFLLNRVTSRNVASTNVTPRRISLNIFWSRNVAFNHTRMCFIPSSKSRSPQNTSKYVTAPKIPHIPQLPSNPLKFPRKERTSSAAFIKNSQASYVLGSSTNSFVNVTRRIDCMTDEVVICTISYRFCRHPMHNTSSFGVC